MVTVKIPSHMGKYETSREKKGLTNLISIDPCILDEIKYLWSLGFITYGSCCGHNVKEPFVNVSQDSIPLMNHLGYIENHSDKNRKDTFRLKSV
jgi:hypothetical protein